MKYFYLVILFTIYSQNSFAFINIESLRQSDKQGLLGSFGLKVNGAAGNTNKFSTSTALNNLYRSNNNEYLSLVSYSYGENSNEKNIHKGQIHLRYTTSLPKDLFLEVFTQIEFDDFKALKYRKLIGLGLRYKFLNTDTHKLACGLGILYESEALDDDTKNILYRANLYASYKAILNKNSNLTFVNYFQPSVDDIENFRFKSHLNLKIKFYKSLALTNEVRYSFDSNVKAPVKKGDVVYMTGFSVKY